MVKNNKYVNILGIGKYWIIQKMPIKKKCHIYNHEKDR